MDYYIKLQDGTEVPVTEEIFRAYYRPVWKEQKRQERWKNRQYSLSVDEEKGRELSSELDVSQIIEDKETLHILGHALESLSENEEEIINSLFFEGISEREFAREKAIPQKTVNDRKKKILKKLKEFLK